MPGTDGQTRWLSADEQQAWRATVHLSQLVQQRKAGLEVTEGVPGLAQGQMAVRYLPQAQGVRAVGSLGLESLRRLPVRLDSRLVAA